MQLCTSTFHLLSVSANLKKLCCILGKTCILKFRGDCTSNSSEYGREFGLMFNTVHQTIIFVRRTVVAVYRLLHGPYICVYALCTLYCHRRCNLLFFLDPFLIRILFKRRDISTHGDAAAFKSGAYTLLFFYKNSL